MNDHGWEASLACGFPMDIISHSNVDLIYFMHSTLHAHEVHIEATCYALFEIFVELAIVIIVYFDV